jgi:uncharacterized repeat protein (TIGR01451 family)
LSAVTRRVLPLAAAGLAACAGIAAAALKQEPGLPVVQDTKVTICHATESEKNAYVQLQVDDDSIVKENGHGSHPDDIIPPFDYVEGGETKHFPGLNWPGGIQTWLNGCEVPPPTPQPLPVQPFVKCVDDNGGTFQAVFGYSNPNTTAVTVSLGSGNSFSPDPADRGQPTTFNPGTVESAVTVTGAEGAPLVWNGTVGGVTSSASATASFPTSCSVTPPPTLAPIEISVICVDNVAGSFNATFGYANAATEAVTIPAGTAANSLSPPLGTPPSTFQPGGGQFSVIGIPDGTSLTWTLTSDHTRTATATSDFAVKCTSPPTPKPIAVSVTCIQDRGGTFDVRFGYVNPNGASVDIPAGPNNQVTIGVPTSAGQPTTFTAGTVTSAFTVTNVPAGASVKWSVTYAGTTSVATADESFPTRCGVDPPNPPDPYRIGVFVTCVTNNGDTYAATFGYENEDADTTSIPVGDANRFLPAPEGRGQPTVFEPGNHPEAVTVTGIPNETRLVWSVTSDQTRSAEAASTFEQKCSPEPPPVELLPLGLFVTCVTNHADSYDAVFGYTNDNRSQQIVPLGLSNTFVPAPGNRGQPTTFEPGTVRNAVTVTGIPNDALLVWAVELVKIRFAVASAYVTQKCDEPPVPPEPPPPEPQPPPEPPTPTPPPPNPVPPQSGLFATCVLRPGGNTYDAIFGYANGNQADVIIPVGRRNLVAPAPIDRGQPNVFTPGVVLNAFTVRNVPRTRDLTWAVTLPGGDVRTATASARFPRNCIVAPAPQTADLVLTKTVVDATLTAGQRGTYRIHVSNRGPNIALRVRIVDVVDRRLDLLSASTNRGSCTTSGHRVTCTIAALPPGAHVTVAVAVRAREAGTIRNVASARHPGRDPTPGNNVDSATIVVTGRTGGVSPAFTG